MNGEPLAQGFDALQIVLGIVFILAGAPKLLGTWRMRAMFDHLRIPQTLRNIAGAMEVGAGFGLLVGMFDRSIAVTSALVAVPWMFGAMMTNITRSRRRDAWMTTALLLFLCLLVAYVRWGQNRALG